MNIYKILVASKQLAKIERPIIMYGVELDHMCNNDADYFAIDV